MCKGKCDYYILIYDGYKRCIRCIWELMGVYDDNSWLYGLISWYMTYVWGVYSSLCGDMLIYDGCMREYRIVYLGICCCLMIYEGYMGCMRGKWELMGVYDDMS